MSNSSPLKCLKQARTTTSSTVVGFLHVRNEESRISHVIDHHRQLGIQEFYVVDNMSTDQTASILESYPDVNLFLSSNGFANSRFGMTVMNPLLDEYGSGKWCLMVDADEHFVYPQCEHKSLKSFTRYLDKHLFDSVFAVMVDMYSNTSIKDTIIPSTGKLIDVCNYFDGSGYHQVRAPVFPFLEYRGGPRERVFWSESDGCHPPTISKVPLVKWSRGMRYVSVAHYMKPSPRRLANVTGALLHFKYLSDFHERAVLEVKRKQHFANAREYKKYRTELDQNPNLSLYQDGSVKYNKSLDLLKAGLCSSSNEWGMFI